MKNFINFKKTFVFIIAAAMLALCFTSCAQSSVKYTVGVCQLVQHDALDSATKGFVDALTAEFGDDIEIIQSNAQGDSAACTTIINDFVTKKVDLILANATPSLQAAVNGTTEIPILGTAVTEYGTALNIENFSGTVGGNVSGTSDLAPLSEQAQMILDIFPETKTVGVLYCSAEANSAYQVKVVKEYLEGKGITVKEFPFSDSNDVVSVATAAAAASDALYIPTDNTAASCIESINGVIGNVPAITGETGTCKVAGVATLSIDYYNLGKTTGEMAIKILKGEANISDMPISYDESPVKLYNKTKCETLGVDTAKLESMGFSAIEE